MKPKIKRIEWISQEAQEAVVWISDGIHECKVFSHPCEKAEGETINEPLIGFNCRDIETRTGEDSRFMKEIDEFGWEIVAMVKDFSNSILMVGDILIETDVPLPGDCRDSDVVFFSCSRLDLIA